MKMKSQIGVNILTPDNSAALDIQLPATQNTGVLIPRLTQAQRLADPSPAKGLMVFDITDNLFYVSQTADINDWYAVNPWVIKGTAGTPAVAYIHRTVTNAGIGITSPTVRLDVNGSIRSNSVTTTNTLSATAITVSGFPVNTLVPAGAIIMWSETTAPSGWVLCNGAGGRPDLRGRFVIGYDAGSPATPVVAPNNVTILNYGAIGNNEGEAGYNLLLNEMPGHNHHVAITGFNSYLAASNSCVRYNNAIEGSVAYSLDGASFGVSETLKGCSQVHETRPPYYVMPHIIKLP